MSAWLCSPVSTLFFPSVDVGDHCRTGMIVPTLADHSLSRGARYLARLNATGGKQWMVLQFQFGLVPRFKTPWPHSFLRLAPSQPVNEHQHEPIPTHRTTLWLQHYHLDWNRTKVLIRLLGVEESGTERSLASICNLFLPLSSGRIWPGITLLLGGGEKVWSQWCAKWLRPICRQSVWWRTRGPKS